MSFNVRELPKAKQDKESIFRWLAKRSPTGAIAWLDAYDIATQRLSIESASLDWPRRMRTATSKSGKHCSKHAAAGSIELCSSFRVKKSLFCASEGPAKHR